MPRYNVKGTTYNIPEDKAEKFERRYPDATVEIYDGEGTGYRLPLKKRDAFQKKYSGWSYEKDVARAKSAKDGEWFGDSIGVSNVSSLSAPLSPEVGGEPAGAAGKAATDVAAAEAGAPAEAQSPADGIAAEKPAVESEKEKPAAPKGDPNGWPKGAKDRALAEASQLGESGRDAMAAIGEGTKNLKRAHDRYFTPEGRKRAQAAEMSARMKGLQTRLPGMMPTPPADTVPTTNKPDDEGGVAMTISPTVYDTVIDETGEEQVRWMLPDGSLTTDFIEADQAEAEARKGRLQKMFTDRMSINGLDPSKPEDVAVQTAMDRLPRVAESLNKEIEKDFNERYAPKKDEGFFAHFLRVLGRNPNTQTGTLAQDVSGYNNSLRSEEYNRLQAEQRTLEKTIEGYVARHMKKGDGFWDMQNVKNFGRGLWDVVKDADTYAGGTIEFQRMSQLMAIRNKIDAGGELSENDFSLLEAVMGQQAVESSGSAPHGYTAGKITGEMVPFMIQMAMNPASNLGKSFAKMAVRKYGRKATEKMLYRIATRAVGKKRAAALIKGGATTAGDIAASAVLANTLQAPTTLGDAMQRNLGEVRIEGDGQIKFVGGESVGASLAKAEGAAIIEDYTEMLGAHFGTIGKGAARGVAKAARKLGGGRIVDGVSTLATRISATDWAKAIGNIESKAEWHGTLGEVLEEEAGIVLNSMFVGDNKISDLVDAEQQIDIVLGVGLFGGFVSGIKTAGYPIARHKAQKNLRQQENVGRWRFQEDWKDIAAAIDGADEKSMGKTVHDLVRQYAKSDQQGQAIVQYAHALMRARGYNMARESVREDGTLQSRRHEQIEDMYDAGYDATWVRDRNAIEAMYEHRRQHLVTAMAGAGVENVDKYMASVDADPIGAIENEHDPVLQREVLDYVNAKIARDGMLQRVRDDIDSRIAQSDAEIDARVNRQTGMVQPLMLKDDSMVYVVSGKVAANDDGTPDMDKSSDTLIVCDSRNGSMRMTSPRFITKVGVAMDATEQKRVTAEQIRKVEAEKAMAQINGTLTFNPGEKVQIDTGGGIVEATISGDAVDAHGNAVPGQVAVQLADGSSVTYAKDKLQEMSDAARRKQAEEYDREKEKNSGEGGQRKFALNDEFTILDEAGNQVGGTIIGDVNEDGMLEIETEKPLNGNTVSLIKPEELEEMLFSYNGENVTAGEGEGAQATATPGAPGATVPGAPTATAENNAAGGNTAGNSVPLQGNNGIANGNGSEQDNDGPGRPSGTDGGSVAGDSAGSLASNRDRSDIRVYEEGLGSSQDAHTGDSERDRREAESERLVGIAKSNGQFKSRSDIAALGKRNGKGTGESDVYIDKDSGIVYKVKNPYAKSPLKGHVQPEDAIYEHLVHNKYFPETAYRFEGISDENGDVRIVLSQGYVESVGQPTKEQIEAALAERGLMPEGQYRYGNEEISVTDVTGDNALLGADGKVYFIDPIIDFKKPVREILGENNTEGAPVSALAQVPMHQEQTLNDKGKPMIDRAGNPVMHTVYDWTSVDPEVAWDALVEKFQGDEIAQNFATMMVGRTQKALDAAKKEKSLETDDADAFAISEAERLGKIQRAQEELNKWKTIAGTSQRRAAAAAAQQAAEKAAEKAAAAAQVAAEAAAQQAAAEQQNEAQNGVPDWHMDNPENARKRGKRRANGQLYTRQEPVQGVQGKEVEVKFSQTELPKGHVMVIEASQLQPSHLQGQRNPLFFIDEAQPKNRAEGVSSMAAREIADKIRPEEITGHVTAYTGAPTVNSRGEVIQGNNRSDALRVLWENNMPEQQQRYKQYLIDNAAQFGIDPEAVRGMKHPALVNMVDVEDAEAIRLGQMTAQDTESGGIERIKPKNVAQKLGGEISGFANLLLNSSDEDATFGQLVDRNGVDVLKWLAEKGVISDTQYQSAFDSKGNITAEAKNDLQKVLYQSIFRGGSQQLEEMFDRLPAKAQRALLGTAFRDMESPDAGKMLPEIQASVAAYNILMNDPYFANAKNTAEALKAVEGFKRQTALNDRFEQYVPADNFSNFALHLAAMYKGSTQKTITETFSRMYDLAQGKGEGGFFEGLDDTKYPLAEIIHKVLEIEYQPAKNGNNNVTAGSADVVIDNNDGQGGESGSDGTSPGGEQHSGGAASSERGGGAASDSGSAGSLAPNLGTKSGAVAAAEAEVDTDPTEGQKKAGNYKMGHVKVDGLDITIENPKGSVRKGTDANGNHWENTMHNTYGYIRGTEGKDGDKIDVFLSDTPSEGNVYVVDQYNPDGTFDEHKVMYGFKSAAEAEAAFLSNYSKDWAENHKIVVTGVTKEEFKKWLDASNRKTKPFAEYKDVKAITEAEEEQTSNTPSLLNVIRDIYSKGKEFATKLYQRSHFDVVKTPDFMKRLGLTGDKFTIRFGVIARHVGKDSSHKISEEEWQNLPEALLKPFAITKLGDKWKGYRIYTTLQNDKGEYIVVGVDVKNAGRNMEVNAIATVFGRRQKAGTTLQEELIYTDKNITPEQKSLLDGPNSRQYPSDQGLSADKDSIESSEKQENEEESNKKVAEPAAAAEAAKGAEEDRELTEEEIKGATGIEDAAVMIPNALLYLQGTVNPITQIAYNAVKDYVRNRSVDSERDSGNEDPSLVGSSSDAAGPERSGQGGGEDVSMDNPDGDGAVSDDVRGGADSTDGVAPAAGKPGNRAVRKPSSSSTRAGGKRSGERGVSGSDGTDVRGGRGHKGGKGGTRSDASGETKAGSKGDNGLKPGDRNIQEGLDKLKELWKNVRKDNSQLHEGLTYAVKFGAYAIKAVAYGAQVGVGLVQNGIYTLKKWFKSMHEGLDAFMQGEVGLTDREVDDFIRDIWNCAYTIDGETHLISEWASKMEQEELRRIVRLSIEEKTKLQANAPTTVIHGDIDNIRETLPFLLPKQHEDVALAETQFFDESHNDREHAYGKGYLFTNGTGTGKTFTGLGIVKRFINEGKKNILIVTASGQKITDFINDAKKMGIEATALPDTSTAGTGVVVTQYANMRQNDALLEREFDLVLYDESHKLMENQNGDETAASEAHYMITNRDVDAVIRKELRHDPLFKHQRECQIRIDDLKSLLAKGEASYDKLSAAEKGTLQELGGKAGVEAEIKRLDEEVKKCGEKLAEIHKANMADPAKVEAAKKKVGATKVVFMSATPFNTALNLAYTEGYIFSYDEGREGERREDKRARFVLKHFSSSHRTDKGGNARRLPEQQILDPYQASKEEVDYSNHLQNDLHTMSGRDLDSEWDYSRLFPKLSNDGAAMINKAVAALTHGKYAPLAEYFDHLLDNYMMQTAFFEVLKTNLIMDRIADHLAHGRKVLIYHRRKTSTKVIEPPFALGLSKAMKNKEMQSAAQEFAREFRDLLAWEQSLNYGFPHEQLIDAFATDEEKAQYSEEIKEWEQQCAKAAAQGKKRMPIKPQMKCARIGIFNGDIPQEMRTANVNAFNDDNSGKDILVVQVAAGKEGISLHDTTGVHQRALISLYLPQSPIEFIQVEGRIYRVGNKSNAIFEYPLLGIDLELASFSAKINGRSQTSENLALGDRARGLRDSISRGALGAHEIPVTADMGVGGKERDSREAQEATDYDQAISNWKSWAGDAAHPTMSEIPDPIGYKIMEWGRAQNGETMLVPYAGEGTMARYAPTTARVVALEADMGKYSRLYALIGGGGRRLENDDFADYYSGNKADVITMVGPHGVAEEEAGLMGPVANDFKVFRKAMRHMEDGSRLIMVVDEKGLEQIKEIKADALVPRMTVKLDGAAFGESGARYIVMYDAIANKNLREKTGAPIEHDLSNIKDASSAVEALRDITSPERVIDKLVKRKKEVIKPLKAIAASPFVAKEYNDLVDPAFVKPGAKKSPYIHISHDGTIYISWKRSTSLGVRCNKDFVQGFALYSITRIDLKKILDGDPATLLQYARDYRAIVSLAKADDQEIRVKLGLYKESEYAEVRKVLSQIAELYEAAMGRTGSQLNNLAEGKVENEVPERELTLEEYEDVFKGLNNLDAATEALAAKVFAAIRKIKGMTFACLPAHKFSGSSERTVAHYVPGKNRIELNAGFFNSIRMSDEGKAQCMLHEMIHAVTSWAIEQYKQNPDALNEVQRKAVEDIMNVYQTINTEQFRNQLELSARGDANITYGLTNEHEMMAELANPKFRKVLKITKLWRQLINGIKMLLGIKLPQAKEAEEVTADQVLSDALDTLMDNFDPELYARFTGSPQAKDFNYSVAEESREGARMSAGEKAKTESREVYDVLRGMLEDAGIEVVEDAEVGQQVLDLATGGIRTEAAHRRSEKAEERNRQNRTIDEAVSFVTGKPVAEVKRARMEKEQQRRNLAREIYDKVLKCQFDEVTLQQINNYLADVTPANPHGRRISERVPQKMERGLHAGERTGAIDALFSRICESSVPANGRTGAEARRRIEAKKEECLEAWARATGHWHEGISDFVTETEPIGKGSDSDVYISDDGRHVVKASRGKFEERRKHPSDIDQVNLFNYVFPNSAYRILGYGRVDGQFVRYLEQPFVDFRSAVPLSVDERVEFMHSLGYEPFNAEKTAFSNGEIVVTDLQKSNIVRDETGAIRVIDADVKLHTRDLGGKYEYSPVERDTANPSDVRYFRTSTGEAYGFTYQGKIYIDPQIAVAETPLHEYTHLWDDMVRKVNPKLWARGKALLKKTPMWQEVLDDPNYADIRNDEDAVASEVHARLSGAAGARQLDRMVNEARKKGLFAMAEAVTLRDRIESWLREVLAQVKDVIRRWTKRDLSMLTVEQFARMPLRDLARGVNPLTIGRQNGEDVRLHAMSRDRGEFDRIRERAVAERGIVMPGLNGKEVKVVSVPRHKFSGNDPIEQARDWAKEHIAGTHTATDSQGNVFEYSISNAKIGKYLSEKAVKKSANTGAHLAVLTRLPEIIGESVEAEIHPDYPREEGKRGVENNVNIDCLVHRFYGAAEIDGQLYRIKTTIKETRENKLSIVPHSFEVTEIELRPEGNSSTMEPMVSRIKAGAPYGTANLLKDVEKSYDPGKKLLDESLKEDKREESDEDVLCRPVTDAATLERLEKEPTVKVYRAMQLIDGGLRPPMSAKVGGELRPATEIGVWEEAEEHPEMADENGYFKLDKGNGKSIKAAYNPYIHTSRSPINDQFSSAWSRPNLVTVEVEIPASELTSGYHAEKAKNSTGESDWKSGPISRLLAKIGQARKVILSRWAKVVRIVPVDEVAEAYAQRLKAHGIEVPFNTVPPSLREALAKRGVKIGKPEKGNAGAASMPAFEQWLEEQELQRQGEANGGSVDGNTTPDKTPRTSVFRETVGKVKDNIEDLFKKAVSGKFTGKPVSIGELTIAGREYLERISGLTIKPRVSFMLNPSDLGHIHSRHFGANEKDGRNIPLNIEDIRNIADVITDPDRILFSKEGKGEKRNMFFFLKGTKNGTYQLLEIYADRHGNLSSKSYFKSKEDVSQRVISLAETLHSTPEAIGAILNDGTKVPKMFDNPTITDAESSLTIGELDTEYRQGDGYGAYSDEEVSFANDLKSRVMGRNRFSKKQQAAFAARERERMVRRVNELAARLHLDNVEVVTDVSQLEGKKRTAKGFFNRRTGKITIVLPNNSGMVDVEQTLLHEAVAHYGLRKLFGKHFNTFLDNVYESSAKEIRDKIADMARKNGWDFRTATEEYLAGLAEDTDFETAQGFAGWWSNVKRLFLDMLEKIGFVGFRDKTGVVLTDNELRYLLWSSYENLKNPGRYKSILGEAEDVVKQSDLKVGNYAEHGIEAEYVAEGEDLFRPGDFSPRDQVTARKEYERMVSSGAYQFQEAVQDSMLGLKKLYQAVLGKNTRIEDVAGYENAYLYENRMSSMNAGEQHEYFREYMKPLLEEISKIAGADKQKRKDLTDYIMAKHGLERNEYMRNEAAANDEKTERDFAGLIGLTGEDDWRSAEATARQWVWKRREM